MHRTAALFALLTLPAAALAAPDVRRDRTPPALAAPLPVVTARPVPAEAPFHSLWQSREWLIAPGGHTMISGFRMKILKPEALALGNVTLSWHVDRDLVTLHRLIIHRDGKAMDLLDTVTINKIARQDSAEAAVLDGRQIATVQVPGLAVDDELEVLVSIATSDATLGRHSAGGHLEPLVGLPGVVTLRASWPADLPVTLKAGPALGGSSPVANGKRMLWQTRLEDAPAPRVPDGAPARFKLQGLMEYSDFADWAAVSAHFFPLYREAARLPAGSPLKAEAAKIAAAHATPQARAMAALALVQDKLRYVFVGLADGNLKPASADESWQRRFADCKGKTAVLLALLAELGIEAEAVLVNSSGGDGIDQRLPAPGWFDHVLVRARVDGQSLWLDGTRQGDDAADALPPPQSRWVLPLAASGAGLEALRPEPARLPLRVSHYDMDASAGIDKPARLAVTEVMRGEQADKLRQALSLLAPAEAERQLKDFWRQRLKDVTVATVLWRSARPGNALVLTMAGTQTLDWERNDDGSIDLALPGGGFFPPDKRERPADQDQDAPWEIEFPRYSCDATSIRLPPPKPGTPWRFNSKPMNRVVEGRRVYRATGMVGDVARLIRVSRTLVPEISAAEARATNAAIAGFDNNKAVVLMARRHDGPVQSGSTLPFADGADWTAANSPCQPPGT